jgi:hypothetical protein
MSCFQSLEEETPVKRSRTLFLVPLLTGILASTPGWADSSNSRPAPVQFTYRGGPLIQQAQVSTLFWGSGWKGNTLSAYLNSTVDKLVAPDGTLYLVAKVWSNQAGAPVAFAATAGRRENMSRHLGVGQIQPLTAAAVGEGVKAAAELALSMPAGALQLGLTAGPSAYAPGEPGALTLTVTNPGPAAVTLAFTSSQQYDFEVRLGERTLWRWSAERAFSQALTQRTLGPGERWVVTESWDGRDDQGQFPAPGTYGVVARLTSPANPLTATLPLWIGD